MACTAAGDVIYVDDDAYLGGNGQNWATPYRYLQDALAVAWSGYEIRVAQGIYKPDENSAHPNGNGSRTATFQLKNGVVITGGYAGLGEPNPNARDIEVYETILSGDIRIVGNNSDNSFHIVTGSYTDSTAVLDGFTVTGGNVDIETGQEMPFGAGMFALDGSATLANCTFTGNSAYAGGGVCYLAEETEVGPTLTNCTFTGNSAEIGGGLVGAANNETAAVTLIITNCTFTGNSATSNFAEIGMGGALYHALGTLTLNNCIFTDNSAEIGGALIGGQSNSTLTNCTFTGNSATGDGDSEIVTGGAIYNESGSATIINCIFSENSCSQYGGAISEALSSSSLYNCLFTGNSCSLDGGAIYYWYESRPNLVNCTFAGNTAPNGNAIACSFPDGGGVSPSTLRAFNCIFWDGGSEIFNNNNSFIAITYSDVQGGWQGIGNINADPLFVEPAIGDYHLLLGSQCIDTGDNSAVPSTVVTDLDGNPRIIDGIVDMGAYEGPYQGFLLSAKSVIVPEGGTATFTVAPMVDPLGTIDVTVAVESGDTDITVEAGGLLTFDSTNYSQPQTVTLAAAKDVDELHGATVILVSAPGIYPASITAYELDSEGPTVLYVDCDALGANDGGSWENAFTDLREGLRFAAETFWVREIRVAQGAYSPEGPLHSQASNPNPPDGGVSYSDADLSWTPGAYATLHDVYFGTTSPGIFQGNQIATTFDPGTMAMGTKYYWRIDEVSHSGTTTGIVWSFTTMSPPPMGSNESLVSTITVLDREATFQLINGVAIYGGYAGFGEPNADARDIQLYETILSGDIGILGDISDNSYHVVTGSGTDATAVLDGCTINGGNANGSDWEDSSGGGMINSESSPTLTNCTFSGNSAGWGGGGMANDQSSPTVTNCMFTDNTAGVGGGMRNLHSSATVENCIFIGNSAVDWGGGMTNRDCTSSLTVTNCIFTDNSASWGGGMRNYTSSTMVINCTFSNNSAQGWEGGGMSNRDGGNPTLINCTFSGNSSALRGGGIYCDENSSSTITNGILWENSDAGGTDESAQIDNDGPTPVITYSCIQGWTGNLGGIGNINTDPWFVEPGYRNANGAWIDGDYHLHRGSLCINAGDPYYIAEPDETDLDGKPRVIAGRIDMGAYEFNHDPIANAGPDQTVEAQAPWGATATLDCSGSSDADSTPGTIDDINDFNWYQLDPCDPNADVFLGSGEIIDCNLSIGEHIILLKVIDKAGASDFNEVTIIVQDTTPPDIICPPNVILECPADTTPSATGEATATDICGAVTITHSDQLQPSCGNAGTLARTWTATDESGNTSTCEQIITVVDTTPPAITCPADVTLQCPVDTSVEANGSASAVDTCSSVAITHSDLWQPGCGNTGTLTRIWTATDECGNSSSCVQIITVVDTTPPQFQLSVSPTMLWPPDHKMVLITPSWTVSDDCVPTPEVSLVSIIANEGDNTVGDGHTSNDIQINEDGSIYLRSERSGTSDERIYTITYQAIDDCGNTTVRSATVSIPHDFKVLARIASRWLWAGPGRIPEDLNGDGFVNLRDIAIFANNWIQ
jgi:predicted outer membrane repeat protein